MVRRWVATELSTPIENTQLIDSKTHKRHRTQETRVSLRSYYDRINRSDFATACQPAVKACRWMPPLEQLCGNHNCQRPPDGIVSLPWPELPVLEEHRPSALVWGHDHVFGDAFTGQVEQMSI